MVSVMLIEEDYTVVPFMDPGCMRLSFGDEEAVSFCKGLRLSVSGKINLSFDDKLPLACMGMFRYNGVLFEFYEHDLLFFSLDQVAGHSIEWKCYLGEFLYWFWEHVFHRQAPFL